MSADFWAGYISGAAGILIGNPLDVIKVRLQAARAAPPPPAPSPPSSSSSSFSGISSIPLPSPASQTPLRGATSTPPPPSAPIPDVAPAATRPFARLRALATGTAAPVLGYGALNALLFVSYNRTEALLNSYLQSVSGGHHPPLAASPQPVPQTGSNLWTTWLAGAVGGLATWVVSTPTELVKCRAQLSASSSATSPQQQQPPTSTSSWAVAKQIWRAGGIRGFYFGGAVTALRDSVGYGFYFWSYELCSRWMMEAGLLLSSDSSSSSSSSSSSRLSSSSSGSSQGGSSSSLGGEGASFLGVVLSSEAARALLCGGVAGVVTWASIFPLDTVKTRMQAQPLHFHFGGGGGGGEMPAAAEERRPLLSAAGSTTASTSTAASPSRRQGSHHQAPLLEAGMVGSAADADEGKQKQQQQRGRDHRMGAVEIAREAYREGGARVFFRGLAVCSVRAFIVNAAQWAVYEWIMRELGQGRAQRTASSVDSSVGGL